MTWEGPRPKPKPGSLKMWRGAERFGPPHPAQFAPPPWTDDAESVGGEEVERKAFTKLQAARRKVEQLSAAVRDSAFDDWVRRYLVAADDPRQWTQARVLYENYLKRARLYGGSRSRKAISKQELATETQWGKMMVEVFPKKRRSKGWYYPVRLKHGA